MTGSVCGLGHTLPPPVGGSAERTRGAAAVFCKEGYSSSAAEMGERDILLHYGQHTCNGKNSKH